MKPKTSSCSKSKPSNANEGGGGASLRTRFLSSSSCLKTPLHPKSSSKKKYLHSNSKDKEKENLNYNVPRTRNSQKPINSNIVNINIPGKTPKKPSSKTPLFPRHHNNLTSTPLQQQQQQQQVDVNKMPTLESSSSSSPADKLTQTPPVEASVSPEIIAFTSTPPASSCYGAGHVLLSGVSDMRKCRPKGLLLATAFAGTKTNHCKLSSPYSSSSSCCLVPSPVHASMHWLSSPPSTLRTHTHTQDNLTPTSTHNSKSFLDLDLDLDYQTNSPFSTTHSLQPSHSGSANLIRTPDSDSTAATCVVGSLSLNSNNNKTMFDSRLQLITCSLAQTLRISSSSPNTIQPQLPITDRDTDRDSTPFSFEFDSFTTSSTSVFLSQGEGQLHQTPDHTHASSCNASWTREGLMSQIYENDMDESDCCRCLSDDDDDDDHNYNDIFPLCDAASSDIHDAPNSFSSCCSPKTLVALANQNGVEDDVGQQNHPSGVEPPQLSSSCAESISTDGGGLLTSMDSDWEV